MHNQAARIIGMDHQRFYGRLLRPDFITSCVEAGMPLERIRAVAQHTTVEGLIDYVREAFPWQ